MKDMEAIIAAFVDDERVDADALDRALATPEGRAYLIDLLAMRELVADRVGHGAAGVARIDSAAPARSSTPWALAAAAVAALAAGAAGFGVGHRMASPAAPETSGRPTAPAPIAAEPQMVELGTPPAPTRVIRLEVGKDWQEREGGE